MLSLKKLITSVASCTVAIGLLSGAPLAVAQDVTIGADFPLSGPNASYNELFSSGVDLAVKDINDDKWLNGTLKVQYEDSQALPQQGVIAMNKLVNVYKTPYVLSAFTGVSKAVSTIGARTKTVVVNGGGVGSDLADLGPYFWNVIPLVTDEVHAFLPYLVKERKFKKFVLVYVDDPFGQGVKRELATELPAMGAQLVESMSIPVSAQQFGSLAARVRAANPDVIYLSTYGAQQAQVIKQFRDSGVKQQIVSYSGLSTPEVLKLPEAKGTLFTSQSVDWQAKDAVTQRFLNEYKAKYNKMPPYYSVNYYNAVRLFGILARDLIKEKKPVTGENLLAQRDKIKEFDMVGGKIHFSANGTVRSPMQINEITGGGNTKIVERVAESK